MAISTDFFADSSFSKIGSKLLWLFGEKNKTFLSDESWFSFLSISFLNLSGLSDISFFNLLGFSEWIENGLNSLYLLLFLG